LQSIDILVVSYIDIDIDILVVSLQGNASADTTSFLLLSIQELLHILFQLSFNNKAIYKVCYDRLANEKNMAAQDRRRGDTETLAFT
jgi:hypothetical protein